MEKYSSNDCVAAKREPLAHEITDLAARLADVAEGTAARVGSALHPICSESAPVCEGINKAEIQRQYPPLLNDLRDKLLCIERAFNRINNVLERVEV